MKKVLYISLTTQFGGGEIYVRNLSDRLPSNWESEILIYKNNKKMFSGISKRWTFTVLPKRVGKIYNHRLEVSYVGRTFRRIIAKSAPDIIHVNGFIHSHHIKAIIRNARDLKIPVLFTAHTLFDNPISAEYKELLQSFSHIIAVVDESKKNLVRQGLEAKNISIIYNGIDTDEFKPGTPGKFIDWVGRVDYQDKNPKLFVEIARLAENNCPELRFRLFGRGEALRDIALSKPSNLALPGYFDHKEILKDSFLTVLTSTSEALPLVALESMSASIPVVASRVGGLSRLISDGYNGDTVHTFQPEDFLDVILRYTQDKDYYLRVSRAARKTIVNYYSINSTVSQTIQMYESYTRAEK